MSVSPQLRVETCNDLFDIMITLFAFLELFINVACSYLITRKTENKTINNHDSDNFCKVANYIRCSYSI